MKNGIFTSIILFLLLTINTICIQSASEKRIKPQDFKYFAQIEETVSPNTLHRMHISSDIIKKCSTDLNDIRLFNDKNREIPFVILKNQWAAESPKTFHFKVIEFEEDDTCSVVTIESPENIPVVDSIDIGTPERNFKKQVLLFGSQDGKSWLQLQEDVIYDFSAQVNLRKTKLKLPGTRYAFFKLRLCNAQKSNSNNSSIKLHYEQLDFSVEKTTEKKLHITEILGSYGTPRKDKTIFDEEVFTAFTIMSKQGKTIIDLEAGLPCSKISLEVENANFFRNISIFGIMNRGDFIDKIALTTQKIYRFSLGDMYEQNQTITCPKSNYRIYRFEIENKNSPPLQIKSISLQWIQANLYFIGIKDSGYYTLYFGGGSDSSVPDYDISAFLRQDNISTQEYREIKLGEIKSNTEYISSKRIDKKSIIEKNILTFVVILLLILFGIWFYKLYKKIEK